MGRAKGKKLGKSGGNTQKWAPAYTVTTTEMGFGDGTSSQPAGTCQKARPSAHAGRHGNWDAVPIKLWMFGFNGN